MRGGHCDYTPRAPDKPGYAIDHTEWAINLQQ